MQASDFLNEMVFGWIIVRFGAELNQKGCDRSSYKKAALPGQRRFRSELAKIF